MAHFTSVHRREIYKYLAKFISTSNEVFASSHIPMTWPNDFLHSKQLCIFSPLCVSIGVAILLLVADMEFFQNFTPPDFQAKNFTPAISPNVNSFSKKKTQKMTENGEINTAGKNFTLPPALTGWTNSSSVWLICKKSMRWCLFVWCAKLTPSCFFEDC